jgi:uncharacterized protein YhbP (UPF0306 family)
VTDQIENAELTERITRFLDANHVVSLATSGPSGPHAANLLYARDGLALVWVSDPSTRHSSELETDCRVSATVAPDTSDFTVIRGIQMAGSAKRITDESERTRLLEKLKQRYPFLARLDAAPANLAAAFTSAGIYRLDPDRIVLIDNTLGFGHKDTLVVPK